MVRPIIPGSFLVLVCSTCKQSFLRPKWVQRDIDKKNPDRRGDFCSRRCGAVGRLHSDETKEKISKTQRGVKVPSRGRKGHTVSDEARKKMSLAASGRNSI